MSMEVCLIEVWAVYTACSVVSHVSPNRKWKVESRTEQTYSILREDIQILWSQNLVQTKQWQPAIWREKNTIWYHLADMWQNTIWYHLADMWQNTIWYHLTDMWQNTICYHLADMWQNTIWYYLADMWQNGFYYKQKMHSHYYNHIYRNGIYLCNIYCYMFRHTTVLPVQHNESTCHIARYPPWLSTHHLTSTLTTPTKG
jgi:hypothetical protein